MDEKDCESGLLEWSIFGTILLSMMTILFSKWFNSSDDVQWMNTGTSDLYSTCQDVYCLIKNKEVSLQSKLSDVFVSYIGYIYQDNDELKMTHLKNLVNQGKLK